MSKFVIKAYELTDFLAHVKRCSASAGHGEVRPGKGQYQAVQVYVNGKWVVIHSSDKNPGVLTLPAELNEFADSFGAGRVTQAKAASAPAAARAANPSQMTPEAAADIIREYYKKCAPHEAVKVTVEITHSGAEVFITTAGSDYLRSQGENALNIRGEWIV